MKKINFVFVFLIITFMIDIIVPITIPEVNHGLGFIIYILLAIIFGFASVIFGTKANDYFS